MNTVTNSCVYLNCDNNRKSCENLTFFKFPSDNNRKSVWMENCGNIELLTLENKQLSVLVICEKHFDPKFVINSGSRRMLVKHAIPYHHAAAQPSTSSSSNMDDNLYVVRPVKRVYANKLLTEDVSQTSSSPSPPLKEIQYLTPPKQARLNITPEANTSLYFEAKSPKKVNSPVKKKLCTRIAKMSRILTKKKECKLID